MVFAANTNRSINIIKVVNAQASSSSASRWLYRDRCCSAEMCSYDRKFHANLNKLQVSSVLSYSMVISMLK